MRLIATALLLCFAPLIAWAQNSAQQPLEITADTDLVWDQARHLYQARGNAKAVSGDMVVVAPLLEAAYDPELGQQALTTIKAVGDVQNMVQLQSAAGIATAPNATYTIKTQSVVLQGPNIKLDNLSYNLSAQKTVSYSTQSNQATATGNAQIFDKVNQRSLSAQIIIVEFAKVEGKNVLVQAKAQGGVVVKTAQELISAQSGVYNAKDQTINLLGQVKITRGANQLNGEKAVVNLRTGLSSLQGAGSQRVRALFYPNGGL